MLFYFRFFPLYPEVIDAYKKSLGQAYTEAVSPAEKYNRIIKDIAAQEAAGIITDTVAEKSIRALGDSYREIINPIEKYKKIVMDVFMNPALDNEERKKYLESLGDGYRGLIDSSLTLKKSLADVDAQVKIGIISSETEADAIKEQINRQYELGKASKEAALINSDKAKADVEQEVEVQKVEGEVSATELLEKMKKEGKSYVRIKKLF